MNKSQALILQALRTPIGSFESKLAALSAPQLASEAIKGLLDRTGVDRNAIQEVFLGQVLQANCGQAPARQAALGAGLNISTATTTVNKVCSSGLKSIMLAAQQLQLNLQQLVIGGGMESMSQVPFYIGRNKIPYGGCQLFDGILKDGLTDAYDNIHMGNCAEKTAKDFQISRDEQDSYSIRSYKLTAEAWKSGKIGPEVVSVKVKSKKSEAVVSVDEEFTRVDFEKMRSLKPIFQKDGGTITVGTTSSLNDGACAVLLSTEEKAKELGIKPLAKIISYADAETNPIDFPVAPAMVINKLLTAANLKSGDISLFEVNEALAVVPLAVIKILGLDPEKVNVHGGALALGNPFGMSGARILTHLVHVLKEGEYGIAAICNGGGGASGMIIQKM